MHCSLHSPACTLVLTRVSLRPRRLADPPTHFSLPCALCELLLTCASAPFAGCLCFALISPSAVLLNVRAVIEYLPMPLLLVAYTRQHNLYEYRLKRRPDRTCSRQHFGYPMPDASNRYWLLLFLLLYSLSTLLSSSCSLLLLLAAGSSANMLCTLCGSLRLRLCRIRLMDYALVRI